MVLVDNEKALELEAADKVIEMRTYNTVYGEWKYFTVDDGQIRLGSGDNKDSVFLSLDIEETTGGQYADNRNQRNMDSTL